MLNYHICTRIICHQHQLSKLFHKIVLSNLIFLQRLADIAITLLKVSPYDPDTMGCKGLQRYMSHLLPATDWSNETMKQTLLTLLRRVDKMFVKIYKKTSIRVRLCVSLNLNFFSFKFLFNYLKSCFSETGRLECCEWYPERSLRNTISIPYHSYVSTYESLNQYMPSNYDQKCYGLAILTFSLNFYFIFVL